MARLEIELAAVGFDKVGGQINNISRGLDPLNSSIKSVSLSLEKANANSLELEKELKNLAIQFSSGAITAEKYANEQKDISLALSSTRSAAQGYQAQLTSLNSTLSRGVTQTDIAGNSVKKLAGYHSDFSKGIRSSNGVAIEFNRIIQDAPFGIQGIGNNIQQLTANYQQYATQLKAIAAEQGQTVSTTQILKGAFGSILSPLNLLTLGVSAVTAGWTAYTMWSQKSTKATKDSESATLSYIDTLKGAARAQLEGTQNAQKDLTTLNLLYSAYQNINIPLKERRSAYRQLQQEYPDYFKNIDFERTASEKTKKAYDDLTGSILATARARAAANLITKNSERQLENENKNIAIQKKLDEASLKLKKTLGNVGELSAFGNAGVGAAQGQGVAALKARSELVTAPLLKKQNDLRTDSNLLTQQNLQLQKSVNSEISKGATLIDLSNSKSEKTKKQPVNRVESIVSKSDRSAALAGLTDADKETETIRQKYISLYNDLSVNAKKSASARATYESDLANIQKNEAIEISAVISAENKRVANELVRIQNESGVVISQNREKELAQVQKNYDEEILKARDSSDIIAKINEVRFAKINEINDKYDSIRVENESKLYSKIQDISDKNFTVNLNSSKRISDKNKEILNERLKDVSEYFDKLRKLNTNGDLGQIVLGVAESGIKDNIKSKEKASNNPDKEASIKVISDLASGFGTRFFQTLSSINQQADASFSSIITELGSSLGGMLNDVFSTQLSTILKKLVEGTGVSATQAVAALAGVAGGLVSGITPKTSYAGQAAGGALTGAGSGALIGTGFGPAGTVIGAIAGGLIGAIGGIFGASKARKQEELQRKQLEEQQKQTKLLERQNALAYTSSIIGRMTTAGVVTGVEINEFGAVSTKIAGNDLVILFDRVDTARKRGR